MNFGVFIENIGDNRVSVPAYKAANKAVSSPKFKDASLFYQDVGHCPEKRQFGIFNSTDICHFKGALVVTFLDGLKSVLKEVNNRDLYYYFGLEEKKDLFGYLQYLRDENVTILAGCDDVEYVKRKLCRPDVITCENLENVVDIIND